MSSSAPSTAVGQPAMRVAFDVQRADQRQQKMMYDQRAFIGDRAPCNEQSRTLDVSNPMLKKRPLLERERVGAENSQFEGVLGHHLTESGWLGRPRRMPIIETRLNPYLIANLQNNPLEHPLPPIPPEFYQ